MRKLEYLLEAVRLTYEGVKDVNNPKKTMNDLGADGKRSATCFHSNRGGISHRFPPIVCVGTGAYKFHYSRDRSRIYMGAGPSFTIQWRGRILSNNIN